jgi:23S rRNA A1618 N6-methylase RlmF
MKDQFKEKRYLRDLLYKDLYNNHKIRLEIPMNQLIPTYNSRLYYIEYIRQLVGSGYKKGLDIGIGSSCIYPILGSSMYGWDFVGTEIDEDSLYYATENVKRNRLETKIQLICTKKNQFFPYSMDGIHFTMCNPPFYSSQDHIAQSREKKALPPTGVCTGTSNEMITEGGEAQFILQMITESKRYPSVLFTTLVGIKATLDVLIPVLESDKVQYNVHAFKNGRTRRSILSWQWL